jgi:hypothetical protein
MGLSEWIDQLGAAAMLGTERVGAVPPVPDDAGALYGILQRVSTGPREHALLTAGGIAAVYTRAGMKWAAIAATPAIAPPADKPRVSNTSAQQLSLLIGGHFEEVLPEYLELAARSGRALPPRHLPALLSQATRDEKLRPLVLAALDARARWLADQNRDWKNLFAQPDVDLFHTGTAPERREILDHLRFTDPSRARTLIESTWAQEPPEVRAAFMEILATRLSMEDEPFLETALDDKRKEVRSQAAALLSALPESRLSKRMLERFTPLVKMKKTLLGKIKLEIFVPETHDPAMARDGIDAKSSRPGLGEKAAHLADIIAGTPLWFWTGPLALDPESMLALLKPLEWKEAVTSGLTTATVRQKNQPFAAALLRYWITGADEAESRREWQSVAPLMAILTPQQREAVITPLFSQKEYDDHWILVQMLHASTHFWSKEFSAAFLEFLWRVTESQERNYVAHQGIAKQFGRYVHPSILPELMARLKADPNIQSDHLDKFISIVHFRQEMQREFLQ